MKARTQERALMPKGLNREAAASYIGVSLPFFDTLDEDGILPPPKVAGPYLLWDRIALDAIDPALLREPPPRAVPPEEVAIVYVLAVPGFVKIGFTARGVAGRIAGLQTGSPHPIEVVALVAGSRLTERGLHERFAAYRAAGEWFRREGAVAEWIDGGCKL
jgi:hypothetical protein